MSNQPGVIFVKRPRGRKLRFMLGGPTLAEAPKYILWDVVEASGDVIVWVGGGEQHQLRKPS